MIVVESPDNALLVVRQPDHAASAARIARRWRRPDDFAPAIWDRLIEAVRRHDDGWMPTQQAPPLDAEGRPLGFQAIHTTMHVEIWRRGIDMTASDDLYAALLISQHARWLYTHVGRGGIEDEAAAMQFADDLARRIDRYIRHLQAGTPEEIVAVEPHRLAKAQRLLSFFDYLSLALIGALPVPAESLEPLAFASQVKTVRTSVNETRVEMDPWPFDTGPWTLDVTATRLDRSRFTDPAELAALIRHPETRLTWRMQPR